MNREPGNAMTYTLTPFGGFWMAISSQVIHSNTSPGTSDLRTKKEESIHSPASLAAEIETPDVAQEQHTESARDSMNHRLEEWN